MPPPLRRTVPNWSSKLETRAGAEGCVPVVDGRLQIDQQHPVAIKIDQAPWAPMSTFGTMLTARDEFDLYQAVCDRGYAEAAKAATSNGERDRMRNRDRRIIRVARRWRGDPLLPPPSGKFFAGDVAAIRTAVSEHTIEARHQQRLRMLDGPTKPTIGSSIEHGLALDMSAEHWLYTARSYFVGAQTLVGLVDCELPTAEDLDDLRLPTSDVVIYFGGDLTIPQEVTADDHVHRELVERVSTAMPDETGHVEGDRALPYVVPGPLFCVDRNQPVQLCGVALHADEEGRLDDIAMWLVTCPDQQIPNRHALYGFLSRSKLKFIAVNLAAAIAWGQWTPPSIDDLPDDRDPRFRDVIRSSKVRKVEPHGGALGVHVLDVKRTIRQATNADPTGTHASPATHTRRAHWNRYRVGPRDDWHYERRFIPRTIVNPGHVDDRMTVYRLPPPP